MNDEQLLRYSRHILLPEIGVEGQEKLLASSALVIGAGGLGSPAALYLAAAGVGTIILADGDAGDLTNLQRQILHTTDPIGRPKTASGAEELEEVRCAVMGVFAPLTGIIGTVQAAEALKLLAGAGETLKGRLLILDALAMQWRTVKLAKDPACAVCARVVA